MKNTIVAIAVSATYRCIHQQPIEKHKLLSILNSITSIKLKNDEIESAYLKFVTDPALTSMRYIELLKQVAPEDKASLSADIKSLKNHYEKSLKFGDIAITATEAESSALNTVFNSSLAA